MSDKTLSLIASIAIIILLIFLTIIFLDESAIVKSIKNTITYQKLKLNREIKRKFKQGYTEITFKECNYYPIVINSIKEKYDVECSYGICEIKKKGAE